MKKENESTAEPVVLNNAIIHNETLLQRIVRSRELGILAALAVICLVMSLANKYFLKPENIFNVLRSMSMIGVMAIGMTMVIITGGIDLSVGSILGACSMLTARFMYEGVPPLIAVLMGIAFGLVLGLINGLVITKVKITPFVMTLGMLSMARGLTFLFSTGLKGTVSSNIPMPDAGVNFLGGGYIGPIPFPIIELFGLSVIFTIFLRHTVLGRQIYATGSNIKAAKLSGVNVDRVRIFTYVVTGGLCALAGVMTAGLLGTAATNYGMGAELDVIAAVVIGGASLLGGEGTIKGAMIGAAIMAVIRNAFVLLKLPSYMQTLTIGAVIVLAVATDRFRKHVGRTE